MDLPRVGAELSGYRLESVIARGGMSTVFLAEHLRLGRKVAFKILAADLSEDDTFRERFVRESRAVAALDHPNIIPIFEAGESGGMLFIAMRYVPGPHLKALIQEIGPLPTDRLIPIIAQVASALDAAHGKGLIHRDVKPGNILVDQLAGADQTDHVYLCDFGLTKRASSHSGLTRTGQFVGTIDYIAPEQVEGKEITALTDVYSLGCVLYEGITGRVPFDKSTEAAVLWAHVQESPEPVSRFRPDLPSGIDGVILRAMAKSPEARFGTCAALASELRSALASVTPRFRADETVLTTQVSPGGTERRFGGYGPGQEGPTLPPPSVEDVDGLRGGTGSDADATREPGSAPALAPGPLARGRRSTVRATISVAVVFGLLLGGALGWFAGQVIGEAGVGGAQEGEIYRRILLAHVPEELASTCHPSSQPPPSSLEPREVFATARCERETVSITYYRLIHTREAMNLSFRDLVEQRDVDPSEELATRMNAVFASVRDPLQGNPSGRTCGESALGDDIANFWFPAPETDAGHVESPYAAEGAPEDAGVGDGSMAGMEEQAGQPIRPRGYVACFSDRQGYTIAWTDNQTTILSIATGSQPKELYAWWERSAGPLVEPHAMDR